MSEPVTIPTEWECLLERRGVFGRKTILMFVVGRIAFQVGGRGRRGWVTRTVADTPADAVLALQEMRQSYLFDRYVEIPWDNDLVPALPDEMLDPAR
ncbi:hypothetical protein [Microlunatus speluncae]|uniref:hypothetical protein n=1 Tax=Microlunatus speluncae TaxID=2594267 RepID=UPI0012665CDC|nr:hypothetical protein [Microlunatus speluncae]